MEKEKQMQHKNCKNEQLLWKDFKAKRLSAVQKKKMQRFLDMIAILLQSAAVSEWDSEWPVL